MNTQNINNTSDATFLSKTESIQEEKFSPQGEDFQTFSGPIKTTADLKLALISSLGKEKGLKMYNEFLNSVMVMSFGTLHKEMDRAQKASKKMRLIYKDLHE